MSKRGTNIETVLITHYEILYNLMREGGNVNKLEKRNMGSHNVSLSRSI